MKRIFCPFYFYKEQASLHRFCTKCIRSRRLSIMIMIEMIILSTSQNFSLFNSHMNICLLFLYNNSNFLAYLSCWNEYVMQSTRLNSLPWILRYGFYRIFFLYFIFLSMAIISSLVSAKFQRRHCTSASMPCSRHPRYAKFIYWYVIWFFCHPVVFWTVPNPD